VADRRSAFDAEGLPFALSAFDLQADGERVTQATAEVDNSLGVDPVRLKSWLGAAPQRRHNEMPLSNAIVNFDPAR
jgi:hypothetical protein